MKLVHRLDSPGRSSDVEALGSYGADDHVELKLTARTTHLAAAVHPGDGAIITCAVDGHQFIGEVVDRDGRLVTVRIY